MQRYVCVHGHFYQPPRENPWLEYVELQDSAYPYHDWNERISAECYAPNATSRILNPQNKITRIVNNYAGTSFNFGPTLLAWLRASDPETYRDIVDADRRSQQAFSGHGSAMAQAYNHMILPLANDRDKRTQVLWGKKDFEYTFGHEPEGMWLPETAVDIDTLEVLAEHGIRFTVLAPHQARRTRRIGEESWQDVDGSRIDPTMAYTLRLPSNRTVAIFFYDGPISRAVAFENLLARGEQFADRLVGGFSEDRTWPQIVNIATDGETYGHHYRHGEMALSYALDFVQRNALAVITNYGEYLEKHPPTHEVEIIENTSWSCIHGIERWRSDCGCRTGPAEWQQSWRGPLREAMDWLRDSLAPRYIATAQQFLKDPWAARDDYISVVHSRTPGRLRSFLSEHAARSLGHEDRVKVLKLLELQRNTMLMYTSCGWFFNEVSGIETVQVLQYAGRTIQLAHETLGADLEPGFLEILGRAQSNIENGDGRSVYERFVRPATVDLRAVAAHYAISSLFEDYDARTRIYSYRIDNFDYHKHEAGRASLAVGRARVTSEVTQESSMMTFGVLHFGDHNINAGVREYRGPEAYRSTVQELDHAFSMVDFPEVIRIMDKHFETTPYSLRSLFRDQQRKTLTRILESTLSSIEASYRQVYASNYPLMRFLNDLRIPLPRAMQAAAEFILNTDLSRALADMPLDAATIQNYLEDARTWRVPLDAGGLSYILEQTLNRMMKELVANTENGPLLAEIGNGMSIAHSPPFDVDIRKVQNYYYSLLHTAYPKYLKRAKRNDVEASLWVSEFASLGEELGMQVD